MSDNSSKGHSSEDQGPETRMLNVEHTLDRVFIRVPAGVESIVIAGIDRHTTALELQLATGFHPGAPAPAEQRWALYGVPSKKSLAEGDERRVVFAVRGGEELTLIAVDVDGVPVPLSRLGAFRVEALSPWCEAPDDQI